MSLLPRRSHTLDAAHRDLAGRRIGVLGMARSGVAAVPFLRARGAWVAAMDSRPAADLIARGGPDTAAALAAADAVLAPCDAASLPPLDMLVISPGVPTEAPVCQAARAAGAEVIGELELAYRFCDAPMVAVTGTNGKGTTVTALGAILAQAGIPHVVAGNIGLPLISQVERSAGLALVVAEVSSFQLETTVHFHPLVAVLLNITEDHLERYPDFAAYREAKRLVFRNQTPEDWAVFCTADPEVSRLAGDGAARSLCVSAADPAADAFLDGDCLTVRLPGQNPVQVARRADLPLRGEHHVTAFLTAALIARLWDVAPASVDQALRAYQAAPHLMTLVGEFGGIRFVDDSKATNPASAIADLEGIEGPVVVIAGGKEKDTPFEAFGRTLAARARKIVLLGECAARIEAAVGRPGLCSHAASMQDAVAQALAAARPGDTVALCPGCSSLDMFCSYALRGDAFARAVTQQATQQATQPTSQE
jgi:UDP-N-acetylmuramoylalanine--D-glutamate ligase